MKKILIAVPCMNQVPAEFAHSLSMLEKVDYCAVDFKIGSLVYTSRDQLAKDAIEAEADYVLWLDSDMIFPADTLKRMLKLLEENDNIDIACGLYFRRVQPFTPTLFEHLEVEDGKVIWSDFKQIDNKPFEVAGCGFGCVLMPTDALISVQTKYDAMFSPINGVGEDLSFCWRARQCGYHIWCDPTIPLGHVGYTVITKEYFLAFQEKEQMKNADKS